MCEILLAMSSNNKSMVSSGRGTNKNKSQHHGKSDQTKSSDSVKHDKAQVGIQLFAPLLLQLLDLFGNLLCRNTFVCKI